MHVDFLILRLLSQIRAILPYLVERTDIHSSVEYYQSAVSCAVNSTVVTYNAALNKPAYQSSVYCDGRGAYLPNLANDGDHETSAFRGNVPRCAHSRNETNPWWAVDLGRPTTVYRVDFTNRRDHQRNVLKVMPYD